MKVVCSPSTRGHSSKDVFPKGINCPVCGKEGIPVPRITVAHLVSAQEQDAVVGEHYQICMDRDCDVVYYTPEHEVYFSIHQVREPIWFKREADPKYACYCSRVTEAQVITAVVEGNANTITEVMALTGAMKNAHCREKNPLGICCHKILQEALEKGLALKEQPDK